MEPPQDILHEEGTAELTGGPIEYLVLTEGPILLLIAEPIGGLTAEPIVELGTDTAELLTEGDTVEPELDTEGPTTELADILELTADDGLACVCGGESVLCKYLSLFFKGLGYHQI